MNFRTSVYIALLLFLCPTALAGLALAAQEIVEEVPRTDAPVGPYTYLFEKKHFSIADTLRTRSLSYYWFAPGAVLAGKKYPLVVILHGGPGNAYAAQYLISAQMQAAYPAFIVLPQSPRGKLWAMPESLPPEQIPPHAKYEYHPELESLPDVVDLVDRLKHEQPIDEKRIYIVGCSDGGTGVYGAAFRYPDLFAAGVAISGTWSVSDAAKMYRVPLQIWHGASDRIMPVGIARRLADGIKQAGGQVSYTELANFGHQCFAPDFYPMAMWQWLFEQKKG